MASAFQERKLREIFAAFDADGDGYLREDDFRALVARWRRLPAAAPGTELGARVEALLMGWWTALSQVGDASEEVGDGGGGSGGAEGGGGGGGVGMSELLALVDRLPTMVTSVTATADIVFEAVDTDGDGRICAEEHRRLVETWNGRRVDMAGVFELLDLDGDGHLTRAKFTTLWRQFWISDDPAAPGNVLCGRLPA